MTKNIDNMIDKISVLMPINKEQRPAGYFTAREFAARTNISYSQAKDKLLALFRAGKIDRTTINEDGHTSYVYGLPDESNE
jgi:predicted transcriptional regulator